MKWECPDRRVFPARLISSNNSLEGSDQSTSNQLEKLKFYHTMAQTSSTKLIYLYSTTIYTQIGAQFFGQN